MFTGEVFTAVLSAVLPVFFVAAAGYTVRQFLHLDVRTLATLNLYIFIPSLIFANLSEAPIVWSLFGRLAAGSVLMVALMSGALALYARVRGIEGADKNALMMTLFPNLGNFGLPVVAFAFGEESMSHALVILVCGSFLQNTVGVYYAQRSHYNAAKSVVRVLSFPMVYAFALAMLYQRIGVDLTESSSQVVRVAATAGFRGVRLLADAAIPVQLMILGTKLAETRLSTESSVFVGVGVRLCLAPVLAFGVVMLVGLTGLPAKVFILQLSGPTAVAMAVYGVQFNVRPGYLASAVSWSFLFSLATVSVVLGLLYTANL